MSNGTVSSSIKEPTCSVIGCSQSVVPGTEFCGVHQADGDKSQGAPSGGPDGSLSDGTAMGGTDPSNGYFDGTLRGWRSRWTHDGELRVIGGDDNTIRISGTAIVYSPWTTITDQYGRFMERVLSTAIEPIIDDGTERFLLLGHDWKFPLASTKAGNLTLQNTKTGLMMAADLDASNPIVQHVASAVDKGVIRGMSFAFTLPEHGDLWDSEMTHRTIMRFQTVPEVTITPAPAYSQTNIKLLRAIQRHEQLRARGDAHHRRAKIHAIRLKETRRAH